MTRYVLAVSGGVDSMVLLDMMRRVPQIELIVAHFDHGIRAESAEDARFVKSVASKHNLTFESHREELGANASEAEARTRRYEFLYKIAKKYNAQLVTAHHLDDLVESVAINLTRGTGWRGLAVFNAPIHRPLVHTTKAALLSYAKHHKLDWREDRTNASDVYLRNRLRPHTTKLPLDTKRQLHALQAHQKVLRQSIHTEVTKLIGEGPQYSRYFFTNIHGTVALECLREVTNGRLTRPQLARLLHAIKTATHGSRYQAGNNVTVDFTTRYFVPKLLKL